MARWHIQHAAYDHERLSRITTPELATRIQRFVAVRSISRESSLPCLYRQWWDIGATAELSSFEAIGIRRRKLVNSIPSSSLLRRVISPIYCIVDQVSISVPVSAPTIVILHSWTWDAFVLLLDTLLFVWPGIGWERPLEHRYISSRVEFKWTWLPPPLPFAIPSTVVISNNCSNIDASADHKGWLQINDQGYWFYRQSCAQVWSFCLTTNEFIART